MRMSNDDVRAGVGDPPSAMAVAIALLGAIAAFKVASFDAAFVARAVATELVTVHPVRVRPANLARPAHDAPPSMP
jgi:hypothetical protein